MILALALASCKTASEYASLDPETLSQVRRLEAYIDMYNLNVPPITAWNFVNVRNNHRNLVLIRVTEHRMSLNETPRAYPLNVDMEAEVLKVYRGILPDKAVTLVSAYEELPEMVGVPVGRKFFLFFDIKNPDGTIMVDTGCMWKYDEALESIVTDPNIAWDLTAQ